jgi:hypothetical protein
LYCRNPNAIKLFDFNKVIQKIKEVEIFDAPSLSYTINAYITNSISISDNLSQA